MIQFVCVKWGDKFSAEWVNRLAAAVARNTSVPHDFMCLTEDPAGLACRHEPLTRSDLKGWWHKVTLFQRGHAYASDRIVYLDLDVVVVGDITHIVSDDAPFVTIRDRWWPGMNSSLMIWDYPRYHHVYEGFDAAAHGDNRYGDQGYIGGVVGEVKHANLAWPGQVVSFKADLFQRPPQGDERIVYFHGRPTPAEVKQPWVRKHWIGEVHGD